MGACTVDRTHLPPARRPEAPAQEVDSQRAPWPTFAEPLTFATPIDVRDEDAALTLRFDVAPRTEEDLEVEIGGQTLFLFGAVRGRKRPRRVWRAFALPDGVDAATACMRLEEGVLEVSLPKRGPRRIPVQGV